MTAMGRGHLDLPQRALDRPRDGVVATLGPEGTVLLERFPGAIG
ncbi:hypothetical protein [Streptomyces goshikiensis]